jgi:hypothetical protein
VVTALSGPVTTASAAHRRDASPEDIDIVAIGSRVSPFTGRR